MRLKNGMLLPTQQYCLKQPEEASNHISLPPASAKSNFQSQILFLFITYQMSNQVNCVNFTFSFIYLFLCFLWLSFGTERLYKI